MSKTATRSNTDFTKMALDSLGLPIKNEKSKDDLTKTDEENNTN